MLLATIAAITGLTLEGLAYIAVAALALLQLGPRERLGRALALYGAVSGGWALLLILGHLRYLAFLQAEFVARLPLYGALALPVIGLYLTRVFLRVEDRRAAYWYAGGTAYGLALVLIDSNLLPLGPNWAALRGWVMPAALAVGWGVFAATMLLLTLLAHRRAESALHRNRVRYWALFVGLALLGDMFLFANWPVPASLSALLAAIIAGYVSLSHHLPDVRRLVQESVIYLLVTLITGLLYLALFAAASYTFLAWSLDPIIAWIILAVILALAISPLRNLAERLTRTIFLGAKYNSRQMLSDYSVAISNILEMDRLAEVAVGLINDAMGIRHGTLFVVELQQEQGSDNCFRLRNVKTLGAGEPGDGRLAASSPLAVYLGQEHTPLTHYDIDLLPRFRSAAPEERAWMKDLGMDVFVPIYAQNEWIGLLALGPKTSNERYFEDDLLQLSVLADQTAVALKNARLVDDLRRLNRTLDVVNRNLAQMDRTKSEFIDIISHELMTPLAIIMGYNQLIMDDEDVQKNPQYAHIFRGIDKGTNRMREIVDTMLDVAKIDTRSLQLLSNPVSISAPIQEAADQLAPALAERKLTLEIKDLAGLPLLETDLEALHKVFYHLIVNAVKYTPDGGRITVSGRALAPGTLPAWPEGGLEVIVADTGIGIDPQHLDLIFAKFYQTGDVVAHSSGKTKFKGGGPGLGLAIVRGLVDAHGGKVWAESLGYNEATCPGSRFHVILPLRQNKILPAA
jgi:signal transduction histidine kinase